MALNGLVVPVPTLFSESGELDLSRNTRYLRTLSEQGAEHLFVLGSLGEFPSVTPAERGRLIDTAVESATGPTDVWVGVGAPSTAEALRFADEAESLGAAALVAVPPYYLRPTEASIERYYRALAAATKLPLLAYNIPSLVGYALRPSLVHRLGEDRVLAGIKDTSTDYASLRGFLSGRPSGFAVLPGNDRFALAGRRDGTTGAVMGLGNLVPRLCLELLRHAEEADRSGPERLQHLLDELARVVDAGPFPSTIKFLAARLRGADVGYRSPYDPLAAEERDAVLALLAPLEPALAPYLRG